MSKTKKVKKSHGGPRKGAGRKPAADRKVPVTIYVKESIIKTVGGIDQVRDSCYVFLKNK